VLSAFVPLADVPPIGQLVAWIMLAVVAGAALIVGFGDVIRLQPRRIWALSSVCFTESMRRRVWLVTPLAIAGVIVIAQLQQPTDDQDAIRQTIKFCLFASGLVVTVTALILASTNLPREIENRVIFTIVTKPVTRLEIVLGKVVGFARVSATILLIMGCFTYAYLQLRNYRRIAAVRDELASLPADSANEATLAHYAASGFLETKSLDFVKDLAVYSDRPSDGLRWMRGNEPQYFSVPFETTVDERALLASAAEKGAEVDLVTNLVLRRQPLTAKDRSSAKQLGLDAPAAGPIKSFGPELVPLAPAPPRDYPALVKFRLLGSNGQDLVSPEDISHAPVGEPVVNNNDGRPGSIVPLSPKVCAQLSSFSDFSVEVSSVTPGVEYGAGPMPVVIFVPGADNGNGQTIRPKIVDGKPAEPTFLSRPARDGFILTGHPDAGHSVADFTFRGASPVVRPNGTVAFQVDIKTEKVGDFTSSSGMFALSAIDVVNAATGKSSGTILVTPELNRMTYVDVPAEDVAGGNFNVFLRALTEGQWVCVQPQTVALITADRTFAGNLFKSFLLLWMLSILVSAFAVFCSTFLSWPIAIVLSLVLLLGHWGIGQLGDSLNPGVGRMVSGDFQVRDPTESRVVSGAVDALAKSLRMLSVVLPDVSQFPAADDVERGVSVRPAVLGEAAGALLLYGITVIAGGYLILRFKEVAP